MPSSRTPTSSAARRASSTGSARPCAEPLRRLRAVIAADAVADALALAGGFAGGCRESPLGDGRVALDWWSAEPQAEAEVERLLRAAGVGFDLSSSPQEPGWERAMRDFHHPRVIGGRLRLRPPWDEPSGAMPEVVVDPGLAFGTGQHATTRMCLELLLGRPPASVLDAGCGSGVLALAALRLGHAPVVAVDHDHRSVAASRENGLANDLPLDVRHASLHDARLPPAEGILANLTLSLMAPLAAAMTEPPRWMILSGLRPFETGDAAAVFAPFGLAVEQRRSEDGWAALLLSRATA